MKNRTMYAVAACVYLLFLAALVLVIVCSKDQDSMVMGMTLVSSGLMVVTLILAVIFMKRSPSERYEELYAKKENEEWEKK
jgi:multisubunit Na+/H+ antiporter MnhC subunit